MSKFHDWKDIRAELDDGDSDALTAERARTEAWASAFHLADERKRLGLTQHPGSRPHGCHTPSGQPDRDR